MGTKEGRPHCFICRGEKSLTRYRGMLLCRECLTGKDEDLTIENRSSTGCALGTVFKRGSSELLEISASSKFGKALDASMKKNGIPTDKMQDVRDWLFSG